MFPINAKGTDTSIKECQSPLFVLYICMDSYLLSAAEMGEMANALR